MKEDLTTNEHEWTLRFSILDFRFSIFDFRMLQNAVILRLAKRAEGPRSRRKNPTINRFAFYEANTPDVTFSFLGNLRPLGRSFAVYAAQDDSPTTKLRVLVCELRVPPENGTIRFRTARKNNANRHPFPNARPE